MKTLKYFDNTNGNKIILRVCWRKLQGNSSPYLSVDIKAVKLNGAKVKGWQEQKAAIAEINPDLSILVEGHLSYRENFEVDTQIKRHWDDVKQVRKHIFDRPVTAEEIDEQIVKYCFDYEKFILNLLEKRITRFFTQPLKAYNADSLSRVGMLKTILGRIDKLPAFMVKNPYSYAQYRFVLTGDDETPIKLWEKELIHLDALGFDAFVETLHGLIKQLKNAPSAKNLFTMQSFADSMGVSLELAEKAIIQTNYENFKKVVECEFENQYNDLIVLADSYDIPTITD